MSCRDMKMFEDSFTTLVLVGVFLISLFVIARGDQSGFISIDCGIVDGSTYTDNVTKINYVSDADFIDSGQIHTILPIYAAVTQLTTLRNFPENTRNCYTLKPTQGKGNRYLIRAMFMYGNYDFKDQLPEFDVYFGSIYWDTIKFNMSSTPVIMEIILLSSSDYIHVCLVNTGHGTPFISTLELRLMAANMYKETNFGPLYLSSRFRFGHFFDTVYKETSFGPLYPYAGENMGLLFDIVRYKADKYDRIWSPVTCPGCNILNTYDTVYPELFSPNNPPSEVMSTAIMPPPPNYINITWIPYNATDKFLVYMYFAELEILQNNQTREFDIYLNDNLLYGPFSPLNHTTSTIYSREPVKAAPTYSLTMKQTENSTLPPIVNALEIYTLKEIPQRQTDDQDAAAMWSIKSTYRITKNWKGDPCVPRDFFWDGIQCSYTDTESPRIVFLNLSSNGLNGVINTGLANLTMIHTLDLSNNNLTGTVPTFLAELNFLKVLNLNGNHFIGSLPTELLAKSNKGLLSLSFDGEGSGDIAGSCYRNHCKHKKRSKVSVPVIATTVSVFVILTALTAIWMIKRKKTLSNRKTGTELEVRKQQYTYSEVQSITGNFNAVLGKGGFGTVYHGQIDNTQVAVKILSEKSLQGDKEFHSEAKFLLSVHHRNITSLVGYCNEGSHKGIIYEYMANGNLESHLFDDSSSVLKWEERLQIGCDAAHGLEYLHHGCKPGIVHRDIKCTNILLNESFQAKLADFGLSKAFPTEGVTHISTVVAGTPGYLDPEYYTSNRLTEKSDVYSFGVVLLVIITGQPAITRYENDSMHISRWVNLVLEGGNVKNIVDPRLLEDFDMNSAWKTVELAIACVDQTPNKRPTMNEVVVELNDCLVLERARQETKPKKLTGLVSLNLESAYGPDPR